MTETDAKVFDIFKKITSSTNTSRKSKLTVIDKDAECFNMNHEKRGHAFIFNHYEFDTMNKRDGTEKDCADLEEVFKILHFDVEVYNDLKYNQLVDVLMEASAMDHSDADCLVIVVLTHGDKGLVYARDRYYSPDLLWKSFSGKNCPSLSGKPKLFFIQACRGTEADEPVKIRSRTATDGVKTYKMPSMADILVMFSSYPGHFSFRSPTQGSWFIQSLCEELKNRYKTENLLTILTHVSRRIAVNYEAFTPNNLATHKKKQISVLFSSLTRLLYFDTDN